ncbi:MAG: transcription elongation factor GreA [Patescibacteria group bacterium]|nr:transcription elongation factor GreA [Patescibacteria group bacterium]
MIGKETYITTEGLEKLKEEYNFLKNTKRKEVANRIQAAKDFGDLSENAEYADAKEEQAFTEGRIAELDEFLRNAVVIKEKNGNTTINVGNRIRIKEKKTKEVKEYEIVGSQEADPVAGKISNESPLGKAFLGKKVGDKVEVNLPKGVIEYEVVEVL